MPATASGGLRLRAARAKLCTPRRIDRRQLTLEGAAVVLGEFLDASHRAQRAHGGAKQGDAGEEEKRFLFGWGWHARA
jgi:hypothetical protein